MTLTKPVSPVLPVIVIPLKLPDGLVVGEIPDGIINSYDPTVWLEDTPCVTVILPSELRLL